MPDDNAEDLIEVRCALTPEEYDELARKAEQNPMRPNPTLIAESGFTYPSNFHEDLIPHMAKDAAVACAIHHPTQKNPNRFDPEDYDVTSWPLAMKRKVLNSAWSQWRPSTANQSSKWVKGPQAAATFLEKNPELILLFTHTPGQVAQCWERRRHPAGFQQDEGTNVLSGLIQRTGQGLVQWLPHDPRRADTPLTAKLERNAVTIAPAGPASLLWILSGDSAASERRPIPDWENTLLNAARNSVTSRTEAQAKAILDLNGCCTGHNPMQDLTSSLVSAVIQATQKGRLQWTPVSWTNNTIFIADHNGTEYTLEHRSDTKGEPIILFRAAMEKKPLAELQTPYGTRDKLVHALLHAVYGQHQSDFEAALL